MYTRMGGSSSPQAQIAPFSPTPLHLLFLIKQLRNYLIFKIAHKPKITRVAQQILQKYDSS